VQVVVKTAQGPADIPGNYFKVEPWARDVTWFVAYEGDTPLGQMAIMRKGRYWYTDYLFVREDARGRGVVPLLIKEMFPYAAEITDYLWENCEGVHPEDLARNSSRYNLKMDIMNTGMTSKGRPFTLIRRHVGALRRRKTA
jgi:hypothetical protein